MTFTKKTKITGALGIIGLAWLSLAGAVAANQRKLVFNPTHEPEVEKPIGSLHRIRHVVLYGDDGTRLAGWFMVPRTKGPHPAVIYFGGRSEEVSWTVRDAARMFPGMAVLAVNYRGYGESAGIPGEPQFISDAQVMYDWVAKRSHVDFDKIAVVGRSLGSGVAIQLACLRKCAAVMLITPYDSILAIAKKKFKAIPVNWLLKHRFESVNFATKLHTPTFVLRSEFDVIVPHSHTDVLVSKLPNVVIDETVKDSDHCNIPYLEATQLRIAAILRAALFDSVPAIPE